MYLSTMFVRIQLSSVGVKLTCEETTHDVIVTNLSDAPVFVQSRNSNYKLNCMPSAVCRIPPGHFMYIFHHQLFVQVGYISSGKFLA